ncbi:hypothetical protein D3C86_1574990 [compost metagenome]
MDQQEMDLPEDIITMVDEDGNEEDFVVIDIVEIHGKQYALLAKAEEAEAEEANVLIMRLENETLVNIDDEEEFNHVVAHLEGHAHA